MSQQKMYKHVGRIKNTETRCVIVFPQLPDDKNKALVVSTENIPDRLHEELMGIVENSGQQTNKLYDLLGRTMSQSYNSASVLEVLYKQNYLIPIDVDNIQLSPFPNRYVELREVIDANGGDLFKDNNKETDENREAVEKQSKEAFNRIVENQKVDKHQESEQSAKNYLIQADMLESDAQKLREKAFSISPHLKHDFQPKETISEEQHVETVEIDSDEN